MPAKDIYHDTVRRALEKDGWTITDDPLRLVYGSKDAYIDLGAEKIFAAEKDSRKIAVEIKSFIGKSPVADLEKAIGQFVLYTQVLAETEPERVLYLAVDETVFQDIFQESFGRLLLKNKSLRLVIFDEVSERILRWIE